MLMFTFFGVVLDETGDNFLGISLIYLLFSILL